MLKLPTPAKRVPAFYARFSSEQQNPASVDDQLARVRAYPDRNGERAGSATAQSRPRSTRRALHPLSVHVAQAGDGCRAAFARCCVTGATSATSLSVGVSGAEIRRPASASCGVAGAAL